MLKMRLSDAAFQLVGLFWALLTVPCLAQEVESGGYTVSELVIVFVAIVGFLCGGLLLIFVLNVFCKGVGPGETGQFKQVSSSHDKMERVPIHDPERDAHEVAIKEEEEMVELKDGRDEEKKEPSEHDV